MFIYLNSAFTLKTCFNALTILSGLSYTGNLALKTHQTFSKSYLPGVWVTTGLVILKSVYTDVYTLWIQV